MNKLPSFREYSLAYMAMVKPSVKQTTYATYLTQLKSHLWPFFGDLRLDRVTRSEVKRFLRLKRKATYNGGTPYSQNSIGLMVATLRVMIEEAADDEIIEPFSWRRLKRIYAQATRKVKYDPFTQREIDHLLDYMRREYPEIWELTLLLHRTGMRIGEARSLQWPDIDFEEAKILVCRNLPSSLQASKVSTVKTATGDHRRVDMSPQLVQFIKRLKVKRKRQWLGVGGMPKWVFCVSTRNPINAMVFRTKYKKCQEDLHIPYRPIHQLRHTFASTLLSAGEPPLFVAAQLGDKTMTVFNTYAHWIPTGAIEDGDPRRGVERLDEQGDDDHPRAI